MTVFCNVVNIKSVVLLTMALMFKNGTWAWDNVHNALKFVGREAAPRQLSITANLGLTKAAPAFQQQVKFKEALSSLEKVRFRRYYQRRCKPPNPVVITIQDVKDVVLFTSNYRDMPPEFIKYFHTHTMDRFLRALIVYFQYYLQVWEDMLDRRGEAKYKLRQPLVDEIEDRVRDDLADLRSMAAREYCSILIGAEDSQKFHHMHNKNNDSLSEKDRRLFETLVCMAVRVVWVALQRRHLSLIEVEMNRLLRTNIFNMAIHKGVRGGEVIARTKAEDRVLAGLADTEESKLKHRSPLAKELLIGDHDHRMLMMGIKQYEPVDERLQYMEAAYCAPEELLVRLRVTVGMLGIPRDEYDATLLPKEKKKGYRRQSKLTEILPFKLPPKTTHPDSAMLKYFPEAPPKYVQTKQAKEDRKYQCKLWLYAQKTSGEGTDSIYDASITTSQGNLLITPRSSRQISLVS